MTTTTAIYIEVECVNAIHTTRAWYTDGRGPRSRLNGAGCLQIYQDSRISC